MDPAARQVTPEPGDMPCGVTSGARGRTSLGSFGGELLRFHRPHTPPAMRFAASRASLDATTLRRASAVARRDGTFDWHAARRNRSERSRRGGSDEVIRRRPGQRSEEV